MVKQYIKLFVLINAFFLFYALGITWEKSQVAPGAGYYGGFFAWTFLPAMFFFLALYGCYSYVKTKKIILPNLLLLLFICLYYFWIFYLGLLSTNTFDDVGFTLLTKCLPFVGISVFCGFIVKLVLWLKTRMPKDDYSYSKNLEDDL